MSPVFPIALALYAAACALYLAHLGGASPTIARVARMGLVAAFAVHATDIGLFCVRGLHPFHNTREALYFSAFLVVGAFLVLSLRYAVPTLGALIVPVVIVLVVAARVAPTTQAGPTGLLAKLHIGMAMGGVALFAVAAGNAIVFLVTEKQLKRHRPRGMARKGPGLETLDRINKGCILIGFPMFTVAMVMGAMLAVRSAGGGAHRLLEPTYLLSAAAWGCYAALLVARVTVGWRGRRAAQVTLLGFAASAAVLLIYYVNTFGRGA